MTGCLLGAQDWQDTALRGPGNLSGVRVPGQPRSLCLATDGHLRGLHPGGSVLSPTQSIVSGDLLPLLAHFGCTNPTHFARHERTPGQPFSSCVKDDLIQKTDGSIVEVTEGNRFVWVHHVGSAAFTAFREKHLEFGGHQTSV